MIFARLVTPAIFFLSSGLLTSASPSPSAAAHLARRQQDIAITTILTTLKTTTDGILPQLDSLITAGNLTDATVEPHLIAVKAALDTAATALGALDVLPIPDLPLARRQSTDDIAKLVSGIIGNLTSTLGRLLDAGKALPILDALLPGLDASLNQVLRGLQTLLQGVLNLVANLLSNVATLLRRLAFGLSLGTLGL